MTSRNSSRCIPQNKVILREDEKKRPPDRSFGGIQA
jgi:hypothetical protein